MTHRRHRAAQHHIIRGQHSTNGSRAISMIMIRDISAITISGKRVKTIPLPPRNMGGGMGCGESPPPIFRAIGDKNFPTGLNMARDLQPYRTRARVRDKTGIWFDPMPRGVSRSAYAADKGGINKKGGGDFKTVDANIFFWVTEFDIGRREGFTKIIYKVIPLFPSCQGEQTMTSPLDCGRSHIKREDRAKMKPAKRGVNIGTPGATKPLRGADGALKKLEGAFKR